MNRSFRRPLRSTHIGQKLAAAAIWAGVLAGVVSAQVSGRLSGTVVDATGAVVPDAEVQLFLPGGKAAVLEGSTTKEGIFSFIGVRPGTYQVRVDAKGFVSASLPGVAIDPIQETSLPPIRLEVASVTQSVEVTATAQGVQTSNAEISSTISTTQVNKLPLLNRQVLSLAQSQAGMVNASSVSNGNDTTINGLRSTYLNVTLDGINIQDNFLRNNGGGYSPNRLLVSQVSEMTVQTSNASSSVGGGAAQINMVSPSGGNSIHGDALWYNRNNALAANDWFDNKDRVAKPFLNENIFGGNLGGPIRKDKLFYYGAYEGTRVHQQTSVDNTVLTPDARSGIFTYVDNTGLVRKANLLSLRGASIDPYVQGTILPQLPTTFNNFRVGDSSPTLLRNSAGYSFNERDNSTDNNVTAKVDYNYSTKNTFTGAFHLTKEFDDRPSLSNTFQTVPPVFNDFTVKLYSGAWRWTPTPNLTNELRGGANIAPGPFGVSGTKPAFFETNTSVTWTSPVNEFLPQGRTPNTYTIGDTAGYTHGRHSFLFGGNFQMIRIYAYNDAGTVPQYNVGMGTGQNGLTTADLPGIGSADLANANTLLASLGGFVNTSARTFNVTSQTSGYVPGATNGRNWSYNNFAGFVQDQWKVLPRLTLTLGVRYDYWSPVKEVNGLVLTPVIQGSVLNTMLSNATLNFGSGDTGRPLYNKDLNNFAPNIALAWDIFGDGKTALRAGYSINYVDDNNIATAANSTNTNNGLQFNVQGSGLSGTLSNPPAILTPAFQVPRTEAANYALSTSNTMGLIDPNLRTPYVQQWNFGIEREIKGSVLSVRYVGNHGVKELRALDYNQVNINANGFLADFDRARTNGNLARQATGVFNPAYNASIPGSQPLTVFPLLASGGLLTNSTIRTYIDQGQIGQLASTYQTNRLNGSVNFFNNPNLLGANLITNVSNSTYNALQVDLRHRYRSGVQFQANYTFSKVLSDANGDVAQRFEPYLDMNNGRWERARAPYDITHSFHLNGSYDLPLGAGHKLLSRGAVLNRIAGGWTVSSLVTWQSGAPFSILAQRGTLNRGGNRSYENTASTNLTKAELDNVVGFYMTGNGPMFINPANINTDGRGTTQEGSAVFSNQAFYNPGPGSVGSLQQRMFNNPAVFGLDASIQKITKITERQSIELRLDALNALNHPTFYTGSNFTNVGTGGGPDARFDINSTSFGVVGYTFFDRRILQLGLHYRF